MIVLGVIAALQVCAVLWHYSPAIKQVVQNNAMSAQTAPAPTPLAQQAPPVRPIAPAADALQIQQLFEEANLKFRLGDFQVALKTLEKLDTLSPNDPKALWMKSLVLEKMDQPAEAVLQLETLLRVPGLPAADRANIAKKIDQLAEAIGGSGTTSGGNSNALPTDNGKEMRSPTGIRAGATLGIVNVRVKDDKRGMKTLSVAVKSLPDVKIVGDQVKILAYFYEQTEDGEVDITTSKIVAQWMSPPIDWAEDEPELLDLQYTLPAAEDGVPGRKYAGYVVGLYYKGELQDFRSDPAALHTQFPLPFEDPQ